MKTLKILGVLSLMAISANAQDLLPTEVPQQIRTNFQNSYQNATDVEWEKDLEYYKVEFEVSRDDYEIWYSANAKVLKTEKEISARNLPAIVSKNIKNNYSGYSIDDVEEITEGSKTTYYVEVEKWNDEIDLVYSANGKLLRETK
ncbi:Putative beta-lactamase-inhibitor-like, PepSY-like [Mesonia phycicola]|uniref:Putative beta-lactamase-inhibitor-like, PepSY-like n=1 Tax=Mesonia phycicola TaxID=579105 RepID=A0A1M6A4Q5_9FLAO|nr:PepSY-like domain-containing protein [Mesonia phycicola]SHI31448.1 Putative beta-lactamase-inhibitor-like, PepSY-like [Mesonia phycicola]